MMCFLFPLCAINVNLILFCPRTKENVNISFSVLLLTHKTGQYGGRLNFVYLTLTKNNTPISVVGWFSTE